jgi:hypothetical protein
MTRQQTKILNYLHEHGTITPLECIYQCGCTKLSTRCSEMTREHGIEFDKEMVTVKDRNGQTCHVMQYRLRQGQMNMAI